MSTKTRATIEDLYKVEGKAELVERGDRRDAASGGRAECCRRRDFCQLREYARRSASDWHA